MGDICPYCRHPYGSTWKNNRGAYKVRVKTKDHVVPINRGGTNASYNIIYCCNRCNSFKGNMLLSEWRNLIKNALDNMDPQQGVIKEKGVTTLIIQYKHIELRQIVNSIDEIQNNS